MKKSKIKIQYLLRKIKLGILEFLGRKSESNPVNEYFRRYLRPRIAWAAENFGVGQIFDNESHERSRNKV